MKKEKTEIQQTKDNIKLLEKIIEQSKEKIDNLESVIEISLTLKKIYKDRIDLLNKEEIEVLQE